MGNLKAMNQDISSTIISKMKNSKSQNNNNNAQIEIENDNNDELLPLRTQIDY